MNGDSLLENFCEGEPIWDYNIAWNTTTPRFTRCFQKTVPIWLPSLILWFSAPIEAYITLRKDCTAAGLNRPIPYNRYNVSRLLLVGLVVLVNGLQFAVDLNYFLWPDALHHVNMADLTSSLLNCFTWTLFGFLISLHRKHGLHTSGLAFFFTFLVLIFSLPIVYMYVFFYGDETILEDPNRTGFKQWSPVELTTFAIHFGLILAIFLLTCFADTRPPRRLVVGKSLKNGGVDAFNVNINGSLKENLDETLELKDVVQNGETKPLMEKKQPTAKEQAEAKLKECPELEASFLSYLTYWWFNDLAITGFKKSLVMEDLWRLNPEFTSNHIAPIFDQAWLKQIRSSLPTSQPADSTTTNTAAPAVEFVQPVRATKKPGVIKALSGVFGFPFIAGALFKLMHDMLQFVNPILLKLFIGFIGEPIGLEPVWHGFIIACGFFLVSTIQSVMINVYFHFMYSIGMRVRSALISAIYRKSLSLSNGARRDTTTGEIVNLMSVDAQRFVDLLPFVNLIWSAPLQIVVCVVFLWAELGPSVLAGLAVMVLMIPLNGWISTVQRRLQIKQMKKKDERVKVISEILGGVKVIKLYGWEVPFIGKVNGIRDLEIQMLKIISYIGATTSFIWTTAPFLVSFVTFMLFVLISDENVLDAKRAFVSLSLFNLLRFPLTMLPQMITSVVMASVSVKRLNKFLNSGQLEHYVTRNEAEEAIKIEGGVFAWEGTAASSPGTSKNSSEILSKPTEESHLEADVQTGLLNGNAADQNGNAGVVANGGSKIITLTGVNLSVPKGSLVAVVGHVGAGKSSLLSAILGDMERVEGSVNVARGESVAYVAQQAWIRNATLRENVLFGAAYEKKRYEAIIEMCALKPDLAILPGGDQTEIGEKGINLSGGQKQRVALARACYQASSIVLLDDPLAAVDSHVARHIFTQVLHSTTGYLRDRTRVLVTNNIQLLPEVDQIFVLESGRIRETGTYSQLMANSGKFADFIKEHSSDVPQDEDASTASSHPPAASFSRQASHANPDDSPSSGQLMSVEHIESGRVAPSVYLTYFRSCTWPYFALTVLAFAATEAVAVASDVWLACWSNDGAQLNDTDLRALRNYRLGGYGLLAVAQTVFIFIAAFALAKTNVASSTKLHRALLQGIMHSPMKFFDTTPLGRIVNRFSKDIDTVDTDLSFNLDNVLTALLGVLSNLGMICFKIPHFLLVILPTSVIYFGIQKFYLCAYCQLSRIKSTTRSPIYGHFGESIAGVSTIRAFGALSRFVDVSNCKIDTFARCYYAKFIITRWLALRLESLGNVLVLFASIFALMARDRLDPGFVGLLVAYSLGMVRSLKDLVWETSEMETNVVSVERIAEYCQLEAEAEWTRASDVQLPDGWPTKGTIELVDYSVRYRPGLELVLKNVSVKISAGMKAAVVGRTGSGKTTLSLALFRILEAAEGQILIDGIDTATLGLHQLRQRLAIIPQDPMLFSGTIRSNLDSFGVHRDELLLKALDQCHLRHFVDSTELGLEQPVAENGSNLSVGQRQLLCLGRALLQRARILVMDEATGSIDLQTDALIQETIRREFAQCTVLTIAHRLHTIIDSDRVMVLDGGQVVEFDSPASLLANHESQFYSLAKDAGIV